METFKHVLPSDIEKNSFLIIKEELEKMQVKIPKEEEPVVMRVIHTTADFDYVSSLCFSKDAVSIGINALKSGAAIVTDTNMALAGINKTALKKLGCNSYCFMADGDVSEKASSLGLTRAAVSMRKAALLNEKIIFAIGNAPTALIEICSLIEQGFRPELVIGVPVGFVNVVPAKEMLMRMDVPYIVNRGRKGGSNVAAAICNALLYCGGGRQ
ncbi:MAG: precorrin-8X methylmutase [Treponema sp.]|nr:precorrin-8X methylmutase [Treponema sp.]MBP5746954.1 precorrin-8X methylmutase [Treponema sp.]